MPASGPRARACASAALSHTTVAQNDRRYKDVRRRSWTDNIHFLIETEPRARALLRRTLRLFFSRGTFFSPDEIKRLFHIVRNARGVIHSRRSCRARRPREFSGPIQEIAGDSNARRFQRSYLYAVVLI